MLKLDGDQFTCHFLGVYVFTDKSGLFIMGPDWTTLVPKNNT